MLLKQIMVGIVAVIIWGIFSNVISDKENFLSTFVSILSNFVFFVVGIVINKYFHEDLHKDNTKFNLSTDVVTVNNRIATLTSTVVRASFAISLFMVILNLIVFSFIYSDDQMEIRRDVVFTSSGYRDIQTFIIGYVGLLLVSMLHGYFFFLGSRHSRIPFAGIWIGCTLSFGLATLLYIIYGLFEPLQISNYVSIELPPALGDWRVGMVAIICWVLTACADISVALVLTVSLWLITRIGQFTNKRLLSQLTRKHATSQP